MIAIVTGALALSSRYGAATAEPLATVARTRIEATLPSDLALAEVHLTAKLAAIDVEPSLVSVEWPRAPRAGTASVRLRWAGRQSRFVPVTVAVRAAVPVAVRDLAPGEPITAADIRIEERAVTGGLQPAPQTIGLTTTTTIAAGAIVDARAVVRPAPIARGSAVTVLVRRGSLRITAHGTLERAVRPGEPALVRLSADRPPVTGTLVAADLVVIGARDGVTP